MVCARVSLSQIRKEVLLPTEQAISLSSRPNHHTKDFVQLGELCYAYPLASHNGLIWWHKNRELPHSGIPENMIPAFVDLQTPDEMYCRQDKIIGCQSTLKQCQNTRFMTTRVGNGKQQSTLMLDLEVNIST